MDTKELIEQIHREFETEGDRLLDVANEYLKLSYGKDHDKGLRLAAVGFKQAVQGKEALELEAERAKIEENAKLVEYYSRKYPLHRFIDESGIKRICDKYNLVFTTSERYKGFVPEKNLRDIETFKNVVKDEDKELLYEVVINAQSLLSFSVIKDGKLFSDESTIMDSFMKNNWFTTYADRKALGTPYGEYYPRTVWNDQLWICASVKDVNTEGMTVEGHKLVKHIPDPVVLHPVKGGFLIVTCWGDEASDPEVLNPINN